MKRLFSYCFIFVFIVKINAQVNLVPNPSFEVDTACPPNLTYLYYAPPWFQPSTYFGTTTASCSSDLFNTCAGSGSFGAGVPTNYLGTQFPKTGNAYAGITVWTTSGNAREYIEVPLTTPLDTASYYCLEYYVSLSDSSNYGITNMGAYFSIDSLLDTTFTAITYCIPQVENSTTNLLNNQTAWTLVSANFIATGGEKYMTIGNFHDDAGSNYTFLGAFGYNRAYYYIDDITLINCDSLIGITELDKDKGVFSLYPNPNDGNMIFEYSMQETSSGMFMLYDVTGRLVNSYKLIEGQNNSLKISEKELQNGIYFYHVIIDDKVKAQNKIVIVK